MVRILKNYSILWISSLSVLACGFNAEVDKIDISYTTKSLSSSSLKGEVVSTPVLKGSCSTPSYILKNDQNGFFEINSKGDISLSLNHPNDGEYDLPIIVKCEDEQKDIKVKVDVKPVSIPQTGWLRQFGNDSVTGAGLDPSQGDRCFGIEVDKVGNVYCAGFTGGSIGEANGGSNDILVTKLNPDGDTLWTRQLGAVSQVAGGDNSGDDRCFDITLDSKGNVYCTGYTLGSPGEANAGSRDIFILKLSNDGEIIWLKQIGATSITQVPGANASSSDRCFGLSVDKNDNIYCAGTTSGDLSGSQIGSADGVVVKLSPNGELIWIKQYGSIASDAIYDIQFDPLGFMYLGGATNGDYGETSGGTYDIFVTKADSAGNSIWVRQFGSSTVTPGGDASGLDYCWSMAVDNAGNSYCVGSTESSLGEANGGDEDAFILKLDTSGNLDWFTQFGATTVVPGGDTSQRDSCLGVDIDETDGSILCSGRTRGSLGEANGGATDAFIVKLDNTGSINWMTQIGSVTGPSFGDSSSNDALYFLKLDKNGSLYSLGLTEGSLGETIGGSTDAFIMKLNKDGGVL